ncbi:FadR/GntR family transcriptional regulator [Chelatococcus asaccharovorans]|uniref:GntR family transcriptional regulator n=2 Tax=Chelatococcus asaccharovorans TaxID=28210 RepID=A0A2V3U360_9HYPH|nr:FadR/GntR family transcriptional regulator [Chelatococcus asaccharovorans]PXW57174.1 GntR family transcriptional regulator [Chelatococcus asaccharovorans]CAH1673614.1 GntR family transcriptional regulator [Chelatococcus asaccharovorans]CAH1675010.1 GntR family transcriptional regulator [Chelatococcus asaccharovorans]
MRVTRLNDSGRREFVIDQLLGFIRSKELVAGSRLPAEPVLSEMFGVSRTVVREAMQSLQATGTIRIEQGRGTFVSENPLAQPFNVWASMNAHRIAELFDVRGILEGETAARAAAKRTQADLDEIEATLAEARQKVEGTDWLGALSCDVRFHRAITQAAGLPLLQEMLEVVMPAWIEVTSNVTKEKNKAERLGLVLTEHADVLRAIRASDPDAARIAMRRHLSNSWARRIRNDQSKD